MRATARRRLSDLSSRLRGGATRLARGRSGQLILALIVGVILGAGLFAVFSGAGHGFGGGHGGVRHGDPGQRPATGQFYDNGGRGSR